MSCIVCLITPATQAFLPCEHTCVCLDCSGIDTCPVCRVTIAETTPGPVNDFNVGITNIKGELFNVNNKGPMDYDCWYVDVKLNEKKAFDLYVKTKLVDKLEIEMKANYENGAWDYMIRWWGEEGQWKVQFVQ